MNKEEQRRFCIFCVFVAVSCIFSVIYSYMVYNAMESVGNVKVYEGAFMVDGEDFAPIIQISEMIVKMIAKGITTLIILIFGVIFAIIGNVLAFFNLYKLSFKKGLYISKKEISLTRMVIWGTLIVEFILDVILIQRDFLWIALLLFWQMPLFANLFYFLRMKKQYKRMNQY